MTTLSEDFILKMIRGTNITTRCDEANNETDIGRHLISTFMSGNPSIDTYNQSMETINNILDEFNLNINYLEEIAKESKTYRNNLVLPPSDNYFVYKIKKYDDVCSYLINNCNRIADDELFKCDRETNKIISCRAEWFESHVEFLKRHLTRMKKIITNIEEEETRKEQQEYQRAERNKKANESLQCPCGKNYKRSNKTHHIDTLHHQQWLATQSGTQTMNEVNTIFCEVIVEKEQEQQEQQEEQEEQEEENPKHIVCGCGGKYTKKNKAIHFKRKVHKNWEATNN